MGSGTQEKNRQAWEAMQRGEDEQEAAQHARYDTDAENQWFADHQE